jgi:hypothetical protein
VASLDSASVILAALIKSIAYSVFIIHSSTVSEVLPIITVCASQSLKGCVSLDDDLSSLTLPYPSEILVNLACLLMWPRHRRVQLDHVPSFYFGRSVNIDTTATFTFSRLVVRGDR